MDTNGNGASKVKIAVVTAISAVVVAAIGAVGGAATAPRVTSNIDADEVRNIMREESPYNRDQRLILSSLNRQERKLEKIEAEITKIKIELSRRR